MGVKVLGGEASYLPAGTLISYWLSIKPSSILVTAAASAAGAILVAANRSVLTAGVMIGLALVPSATIIGMGIAERQWEVAVLGARRWLVEAGLIAFFSLLVFLWKRVRVHQRDTML
jgi:uncharacterized membrane protein